MAVKQRDVVLISKNSSGKQTIDMPITRLGNIDDEAEIKEKPAAGDYIPIMDMEDGGQMKKFLYTPSESSGGGEGSDTHQFYQTNVTLTGSGNASNTVTIGLNISADISEVTVNGVKKKAAIGHIKVISFEVKGSYSRVSDVLGSSDGNGLIDNTVPVIWRSPQTGNFIVLYVSFTAMSGGDKPFTVVNCELYSQAAPTSKDFAAIYKLTWPFYFVEGM